MAISALGSRAGMTVTTGGTGSTIGLGAALGAVAANICAYEDFGTSGITNGQQVSYLVLDSNGNWEIGTATYNSSGPQLTSRTPYKSSSGGAAINISNTNTQIFATALDTDIGPTSILHVDAAQSAFLTAVNRGWGAANLQICPLPQGRLTLVTATPVMTTTQSGIGTVYYTPYQGAIVPIFDGTNFQPWQFSEMSQATTDATKSPAAVTANKVYDIFVWNDGGTLRATRGPAWTNDTTRGYTLTMQNGILLNTSSITNGPAALRGTFVGTIRSNGSSLIDWIFGGVAAGGTAGSFNVWNTYNRVGVSTFVGDNTSTWNYGTNTWRAANASSTIRVSMIRGLDEDSVDALYTILMGSGASSAVTSIGLDSTTGPAQGASPAPPAAFGNSSGMYGGTLGLGFHFLSAVEISTGGTFTAYGNGNGGQSGMRVSFRA